MTVTVRTPVELDLVGLFLEPPPSHPFNDRLLADRLDDLAEQAVDLSRVAYLQFLPPNDYSDRWGLSWGLYATLGNEGEKGFEHRASKRDTRAKFLAALPEPVRAALLALADAAVDLTPETT